jgi:hypothetical protein
MPHLHRKALHRGQDTLSVISGDRKLADHNLHRITRRSTPSSSRVQFLPQPPDRYPPTELQRKAANMFRVASQTANGKI